MAGLWQKPCWCYFWQPPPISDPAHTKGGVGGGMGGNASPPCTLLRTLAILGPGGGAPGPCMGLVCGIYGGGRNLAWNTPDRPFPAHPTAFPSVPELIGMFWCRESWGLWGTFFPPLPPPPKYFSTSLYPYFFGCVGTRAMKCGGNGVIRGALSPCDGFRIMGAIFGSTW